MPVHRSFLFAPGNHPRRSEKAFTLGADAVILDLEDACPAAEKVATRAVVVDALQREQARGGGSLGYVRVNPISTDYGHRDIDAVVRPGVHGLVIPKVETADELRTVDWLIRQIEREQGLQPGTLDLVPLIETGLGLRNVDAIAQAAAGLGRVRRLMFGAGDFTLDMDITWASDEAAFGPYRAAMVLASRAAGLEAPIDTVWVELRNAAGFAASVATARALGFGGKLCIHPDQVPVVNAAFSPSEAQVAHARRVTEAFEAAEAAGSAAIQLDGQFIDYPFLYRAQRVLAAAARVAGR